MTSIETDGWRNNEIIVNGQTLSVEKNSNFKKIDIEKRKIIAAELTPLTGKGFLKSDLYSKELTDDVFNHVFFAPRLTIVRNKENSPVAFVASEIRTIDDQALYELGGIIIDPSLQGSGLAFRLLRDELLETKAEILILRTQNKRMLGLASKLAALDTELTLHFAPYIYPGNLDGYINRNVYPGGHSLYEDEAAFAQDAIEDINWRQGDALVVCGWVIIP